jgi:prepilin signal peptidase PulO-like enzyme (type II secretory pathway)
MLLWYVSISLGYEIVSWNTLLLLILWFMTWVYMVYDVRYMEIPDQIMVPWILWLIIMLSIIFFDSDMGRYTYDYATYPDTPSYLMDHILGALIIYTFLYLQILIPGGTHFLKKKQYKNLIELCLSYIVFPFMLIIDSIIPKKKKKEDEEEEIPTWVGWGDLRVALFIWLSLGTLHTVSTLFFAYIFWSIIGLVLIGLGRSSNSQVPFWPFLWLGWILSLAFYNDIILIIEKYNWL